MNMIGKILAAKLVAKLTERLDRAQTDPLPKAEYPPAGRIHQRNPKLVAAAGVAALALIAAGLSRRRRL